MQPQTEWDGAQIIYKKNNLDFVLEETVTLNHHVEFDKHISTVYNLCNYSRV